MNFHLFKIDFSLPLSENPNAIDYVLPDYNEIKQGYVQSPSSSTSINNNVDSLKKNSTKQQQQQQQVYELFNYRIE